MLLRQFGPCCGGVWICVPDFLLAARACQSQDFKVFPKPEKPGGTTVISGLPGETYSVGLP